MLTFLRRPAISLAQAPPISMALSGFAQAVGSAEGLDGLRVVDDRERARPVRTPQTAIETQASNRRASGSQMSGYGYGFWDSVQAPLTLITAFGRRASSSTFGRSVQGCGGAGGTRGCKMPRWSMMNRVSGWRSIRAAPASRLSQHRMLSGKSYRTAGACDPVETRVIGRALVLLRQHDADSDRAGVFFHSATTSATSGLSGSTA